MGSEWITLTLLEGHQHAVWAVALTGDGRAVSASSDGTLRVWDLESGDELAVLTGHRDAVRAVARTGDGRVVSASWDGTLRVWDLETRRVVVTAWLDGARALAESDGCLLVGDEGAASPC